VLQFDESLVEQGGGRDLALLHAGADMSKLGRLVNAASGSMGLTSGVGHVGPGSFTRSAGGLNVISGGGLNSVSLKNLNAGRVSNLTRNLLDGRSSGAFTNR
jgi:hypothetical protein